MPYPDYTTARPKGFYICHVLTRNNFNLQMIIPKLISTVFSYVRGFDTSRPKIGRYKGLDINGISQNAENIFHFSFSYLMFIEYLQFLHSSLKT